MLDWMSTMLSEMTSPASEQFGTVAREPEQVGPQPAALLAAAPPRPALEAEAAAVAIAAIPARYEVLSQIGAGGMGMVYQVRDRETCEVVALKILNPAVSADPAMQESLRREVCVARKVTHKNVCRIYDFHRAEGNACISMEFVEGESLLARLRRVGALAVPEALGIARQICAGLREAHAQAVVHRDLKPANIMLDANGGVKIMDFGIARLAQNTAQMTGTVAGTPAYMSPEQLEMRAVGVRSDIYGVGLLLYEMVTGTPAFEGDTPIAVALKQIRELPKRPREIVPTLPPSVEAMILKCLQKEPGKRFPSVAELDAALQGREGAKVVASRGQRVRKQAQRLVEQTKRASVQAWYGARASALRHGGQLAPSLARWDGEIQRAFRVGFEALEAWMRRSASRGYLRLDGRAVAKSPVGRATAVLLTMVAVLTSAVALARGMRRSTQAAAPASLPPVAQLASTARPQPLAEQDTLAQRTVISGPVALFGEHRQNLPVATASLSEISSGKASSDKTSAAKPSFVALNHQPAPPQGASKAAPRSHRQARPDATDPGVTALGPLPFGSNPQGAEWSVAPSPAQPAPATEASAAAHEKVSTKPAATPTEATQTFLEVGSFKESGWADSAVEKLTQLGFHAVCIHQKHLWMQSYRVRIGPFTDQKEIDAAQQALEAKGFKAHAVHPGAPADAAKQEAAGKTAAASLPQ